MYVWGVREVGVSEQQDAYQRVNKFSLKARQTAALRLESKGTFKSTSSCEEFTASF